MSQLRKMDSSACSVRLFGVQSPTASPLTLAELNEEFTNYQGPPDAGAYPAGGGACELEPRGPGLSTLVLGSVRASVRQRTNAALAPLTSPPESSNPATLSTCPLVKLRVGSTQWEGPRWIDADRQIVIESPHACLSVTGPSNWIVDPRPEQTIGDEGDLVWDVWVDVKVCRAFCCPDWPPILTEQFIADAALVTDTVRPRSARKLSVGASVAGNFDLEAFVGDPAAGGVQVAVLRRALNAPIELDALPSFTHLRCPSIVTTPRIIYAWEIAT